jgi:hypothetical protein
LPPPHLVNAGNVAAIVVRNTQAKFRFTLNGTGTGTFLLIDPKVQSIPRVLETENLPGTEWYYAEGPYNPYSVNGTTAIDPATKSAMNSVKYA